jgi:hypothetical protein
MGRIRDGDRPDGSVNGQAFVAECFKSNRSGGWFKQLPEPCDCHMNDVHTTNYRRRASLLTVNAHLTLQRKINGPQEFYK